MFTLIAGISLIAWGIGAGTIVGCFIGGLADSKPVGRLAGVIIGAFVAYRIMVYFVTPVAHSNDVVTYVLLFGPYVVMILGACFAGGND